MYNQNSTTMNKKMLIIIASVAVAMLLGVEFMNPKQARKKIQKAIEELGGLGYYNYAAAAAKKKGLIEDDAKITSMEDIQGLTTKQRKLVRKVFELIASGEVNKGPARDEHGNFIKKEGE